MTCPHCRAPLTPWPHSEARLWLRCPRHGYWLAAGGVPLHPTTYRPAGKADDLPLAPGPAEVEP